MTNTELIAFLRAKPPNDIVVFREPGTRLYIPLAPSNIVHLERLANIHQCNLWNDGRGAFTLEERRKYLLKQRGWKELL